MDLPDEDVLPVSAAPEPAAWALLIAGFGLAGAALRASASARRELNHGL